MKKITVNIFASAFEPGSFESYLMASLESDFLATIFRVRFYRARNKIIGKPPLSWTMLILNTPIAT